MLNNKEKQFLLNLARQSIQYYLNNHQKLIIDPVALSNQIFKQKSGNFVTLTINGNLRGCIGKIITNQPLYQDIIENAVAAAFKDPRFNPINKTDVDKIKIEISLLTAPKKINFNNPTNLLKQINRNNGIIIKSGIHQATYLPQVWQKLSNKKTFLNHLCQKAGLPKKSWKNLETEILKYQVEKFQEKNS